MIVNGFPITQLPDGSLKIEGREPMSPAELARYLGDLESQRIHYELRRKFEEMFGVRV